MTWLRRWWPVLVLVLFTTCALVVMLLGEEVGFP